jgi:hypothetical protein
MDTWKQLTLPLTRQGSQDPYWDTARPADALAWLAESSTYWESFKLSWWGAFLAGRFSGKAYPHGYYVKEFSVVEKSWATCVFITLAGEARPELKLFARGATAVKALADARAQIKAGDASWKVVPSRTNLDRNPTRR